jgi:hypothetical protein
VGRAHTNCRCVEVGCGDRSEGGGGALVVDGWPTTTKNSDLIFLNF